MTVARRPSAASVNAWLHRALGVRLARVPRDADGGLLSVPLRAPREPGDRLLRAPVFVLSSMRSGSTLLRLILDSHSHIHAPHETHFRSLTVRPEGRPVAAALRPLDLDRYDLEHLLWDRFLQRLLAASGKSVLVEKTPSNVFAVDRLATAWPDARFVFLLRHPYSIVQSWHESAPHRRSLLRAAEQTLPYMTALDGALGVYPGITVRYEDLTVDPERVIRQVCEHLDLPWEPQMLDYGKFDHGRLTRGLGDWRAKVKTGRVQEGRALPADRDVPADLLPLCRSWGY